MICDSCHHTYDAEPTTRDVEPVVTLRSGADVLQGVYDSIVTLQKAGCLISVIDCHVYVCVHAELLEILESNWQSVEDVINSQ